MDDLLKMLRDAIGVTEDEMELEKLERKELNEKCVTQEQRQTLDELIAMYPHEVAQLNTLVQMYKKDFQRLVGTIAPICLSLSESLQEALLIQFEIMLHSAGVSLRQSLKRSRAERSALDKKREKDTGKNG